MTKNMNYKINYYKYKDRIIAFVLCILLIVGLLPLAGEDINVSADETDGNEIPAKYLGTNIIANPREITDKDCSWEGSYVYFGTYGTDEDGNKIPMRYRVLDPNTTDFSKADAEGKKEHTMLLDCDQVLFSSKFDSTSYSYKDSEIRKKLNGYDGFINDGFINNSFTEIERDAIAGSNKSVVSGSALGFTDVVTEELENDKIFLLDINEASKKDYGYFDGIIYDGSAVSESRKKLSIDTNSVTYWWLRSNLPNETQKKNIVVCMDGDVLNNKSISSNGVSPALNIKLSSVLFSSVVSITGAGEIGAEYKLTLVDKDIEFNHGSLIRESRTSITIPYTFEGTFNHISLLITGKNDTWTTGKGWNDGAEMYHYSTAAISATKGTVTLTLPDDFEINKLNYKVWIFAEEKNGTYETDYAGTPIEVDIPFKLEYDANGGTGSMDPITVYEGDSYTIPECTFKAPLGKVFNKWEMSGLDGYLQFNPDNPTSVLIASNCSWDGIITMTAHWTDHYHNWSYSSGSGMITAKCSGAGTCDIVTGAAIKISVPENETLIYDGTPKVMVLNTDYNKALFPGEYSIKYFEGEKELPSAPVNAGKCIAKVTAEIDESELTAELPFEIKKAKVNVSALSQSVKQGTDISTELNKATLQGAVSGHYLSNITLESSGTSTATDKGTITPSNAVIKDASGNDVTKNYEISYVNGNLTVIGKLEYRVTFKVVNGLWDDGTDVEKTVVLKGYTGDDLKLAINEIPSVGNKPSAGYKTGKWNIAPVADTSITCDKTYIYTYENEEQILEYKKYPYSIIKITNNDDGSITTETTTYYEDGSITELFEKVWNKGKKKGRVNKKETIIDPDGNTISVIAETVSYSKKKTKIETKDIRLSDGYRFSSTVKTYKSGKVVTSSLTVYENGAKQAFRETKYSDGTMTRKVMDTNTKGKSTITVTTVANNVKSVAKYKITGEGKIRLTSLKTDGDTAIIPKTVTFDENKYLVVSLGKNLSKGLEGIKEVYLYAVNLKKIYKGAFAGLSEDTVFYIKAKDANFKRIVRMIEKSKI